MQDLSSSELLVHWKLLRFFAYMLPYFFVFIASLYLPSDPDLGWHLKYGEYFFQHHHVLRENIFSTMMPAYQWANGSWGTDILTYALFKTGGFLALIVASAGIVTATFFLFAKAGRLTLFETAVFFPILIYLETPLNSTSFRGQQISMVFLGILFFILSRYTAFSKRLFFVPLLFLFWCNIHEESFLGFLLFGIWVGLTIVQTHTLQRREAIFLGSILLLTFLATLVNPFGWNIHLDALSHIANPLLKKINEYRPFTPFSQLGWNQVLVAYSVFGGVVYMLSRKTLRQNFSLSAIPAILFLFSFMARRYVWPAYYLTIPLLHVFGKTIESHLKKYTVISACIISSICLVYAISNKTPFNQFFTMSWDSYCSLQEVPCSSESAMYLQKHKLTHIFSYYDWGGWLIWNYPGIKPSIDGRMHLWRDTNGYSATNDYDDYINGKKNITHSSYTVVYLPMDRSLPMYTELSNPINQTKWKLIYEDNLAGIAVRVKK